MGELSRLFFVQSNVLLSFLSAYPACPACLFSDRRTFSSLYTSWMRVSCPCIHSHSYQTGHVFKGFAVLSIPAGFQDEYKNWSSFSSHWFRFPHICEENNSLSFQEGAYSLQNPSLLFESMLCCCCSDDEIVGAHSAMLVSSVRMDILARDLPLKPTALWSALCHMSI